MEILGQAEEGRRVSLRDALVLLDTPMEVEFAGVLLPDGKPGRARLRQQSNLVWLRYQQVFPMTTQPVPSLVDDPGLVAERDRQWNEMGWEMCKLAVFEMEECRMEAGEWVRYWTPVRLVEDGAQHGEREIPRGLWQTFCLQAAFNLLINDYNTVAGIRLDDPTFRDGSRQGDPGPMVDPGGEIPSDAARDSAGNA